MASAQALFETPFYSWNDGDTSSRPTSEAVVRLFARYGGTTAVPVICCFITTATSQLNQHMGVKVYTTVI